MPLICLPVSNLVTISLVRHFNNKLQNWWHTETTLNKEVLESQSHKSAFWFMCDYPEALLWCSTLCIAQLEEPGFAVQKQLVVTWTSQWSHNRFCDIDHKGSGRLLLNFIMEVAQNLFRSVETLLLTSVEFG